MAQHRAELLRDFGGCSALQRICDADTAALDPPTRQLPPGFIVPCQPTLAPARA